MRFDPFIQLLLLLAIPPFMVGIINRVKAGFAGRQGPSLFQMYYDLLKLFQKGMAVSRTVTGVFLMGSIAGLVTSVAAGLMIPLGFSHAVISFTGDCILFSYLLGLGRFLTAMAALDTGSSFEGMGSARELTFSCLAEPALFFGLIVLSMITGTLSFTDIFTSSTGASGMAASILLLIVASWSIVLLVENCRIPFDDPNTHLELTMIHEVMVLDHSGPVLGLVLYGSAIKLFVMGSLLVNVILIPVPLVGFLKFLLFTGMILLLFVWIGVIESIMARLRLVDIPKLLVSSVLLAAFAVVLMLR